MFCTILKAQFLGTESRSYSIIDFVMYIDVSTKLIAGAHEDMKCLQSQS